MTVRLYKSTDTGAPSLTGQAGSLNALLDAILVDGYNGGSPAGAGWTKAYTASGNIAIWRMNTSGGTGFYLHCDDSGTNNTAKEALLVGAESASALNTITAQFPTAAQLNLFTSTPTGGVVVRKSNTADSTARAWTAIADGHTLYLFIDSGDFTSPTLAMSFMFGDFFSYKSSDAYNCMIIGRNAANGNSSANECMMGHNMAVGTATATMTLPGHFIARSFTGAGGSILCGKHFDAIKMGMSGTASLSGTSSITNGGSGSGCTFGGNVTPAVALPYPNAPDGGLYLSPIWIHHNGFIRGYMKGLWAPVHHLPLNHKDTYSGTGTLSGKSFIAMTALATINQSNSLAGQLHVEYSDTWS